MSVVCVCVCVGCRGAAGLCSAVYLHAVVVGAFSIEVAAVIVDATVVQGAEAHEAMLQGIVPLLVHVVVPDYILLTGKPLQKPKGRGKNVQQQVGVYLNRSQNQQQVTLSLR